MGFLRAMMFRQQTLHCQDESNTKLAYTAITHFSDRWGVDLIVFCARLVKAEAPGYAAKQFPEAPRIEVVFVR